MASTCPGGGMMAMLCKAIMQIRLPEGGISAGQISQVSGTAAGKGVHAITGDVLGQIAQAMSSAADGLLKTLSSFWMNVGTPQLDGGTSPVAAIQASTGLITTCTAVVCILIAAGRMAIRRRGQPAAVMALGLTRLVVVSAAATFVIQAAGKAADWFSTDLMGAAHLGSGGWSGIISTATLAGAFATGDGILLIIALLIIFSSLIQLMLMILRIGLLIILTGTLPLAAAASMSEWGESWWRRHIGWLAAWLLYKPAAALLYFGAFTLTGGNSTGAKRSGVEVISGFMLLILAILILPALLKVIVPMTASLGAASSGALVLGAAGAVATGAIKIAALRGTGATAAPSGSTTASAETETTGPSGAGVGGEADPPPSSETSSAERHMAQLPGTRSSPPGSVGTGGSRPQADGTAAGAGPAGGVSRAQPTRPDGGGTNSSGGTGSSRPNGPAGAGSPGPGSAPGAGTQPTGGGASGSDDGTSSGTGGPEGAGDGSTGDSAGTSGSGGAVSSGTDGPAGAGEVSAADSASASGSGRVSTGQGPAPAGGPSPGQGAASAGGPSGAADNEDDGPR